MLRDTLREIVDRWRERNPGLEWPDTSKPGIKIEYGCEVCRDEGWVRKDIPVNHPDFGKALRCPCRREEDERERQELLLQYCQLPAGTERMTFQEFSVSNKLKRAYEAAVNMGFRKDHNEPYLLTLSGPPGCGKTHLAIAIAKTKLSQGIPAKYVYVPILLNDLRAGYNDENRTYEERLNLYRHVPMLILDDLGAQRLTDWAGEQLDILVDHRYIERLETIVTTNLAPNQLPDRIADRLLDTRFAKAVGIDAPSYRRRRD